MTILLQLVPITITLEPRLPTRPARSGAQITKGTSRRFKIDGDVSLAVTANYAPALDRLELTEMGLKRTLRCSSRVYGSVSQVTDLPELDLKGAALEFC